MKTGALLYSVAAGDSNAFRQLYDRYSSFVTRVVTHYRDNESIGVEDLVQEIFLSVWKYRSNLASVEHVKDYLFITAKNKVVQYQMAAAKKVTMSLDAVGDYMHYSLQDELDYKTLLGIYSRTLRSLPARQQKVFRLRYEMGLSGQEVGAMMGITYSTVKNLNKMAKEKLRKHISW